VEGQPQVQTLADGRIYSGIFDRLVGNKPLQNAIANRYQAQKLIEQQDGRLSVSNSCPLAYGEMDIETARRDRHVPRSNLDR
jgi:hypothetical protein